MVEPIFKAPLPPSEQNDHLTSVSETPVQSPDNSEVSAAPVQSTDNSDKVADLKQKILPYLWYLFGGVFVFGLMLGFMMSGEEQAPVEDVNCPLPIVKNPDIRTRIPSCGLSDRSKECILYVMNERTYERLAKDFFPFAASQMGRGTYPIEIENAIYSNMTIYPGYFAQIKIPALQ